MNKPSELTIGSHVSDSRAEAKARCKTLRQSLDYICEYMDAELPPHFPVPATLDNADVAIIWTCISTCQCNVCIENYIDALIYHSEWADE